MLISVELKRRRSLNRCQTYYKCVRKCEVKFVVGKAVVTVQHLKKQKEIGPLVTRVELWTNFEAIKQRL